MGKKKNSGKRSAMEKSKWFKKMQLELVLMVSRHAVGGRLTEKNEGNRHFFMSVY